MDKIGDWALTVSVVSIISGLLPALLPKDYKKRIYRVFTCIMLLYAIIQPFVGSDGVDFDIESYLKDNYSVSNNIDTYANSPVISSAEKAIEELLSDECSKRNFDCVSDCRCKIINNEIVLETITVKNVSENKEAVCEIIESLGFSRDKIVFEGE